MKNFKSYLIIFFSIFFFNNNINSAEIDIYKKIDLFGEVLEKINKEYVDEINQSESMDSAINGLLQSLDPYSAYMSPKILEQMQTETSGEFGGLGIEVSMEAGVVKVISPIEFNPIIRLHSFILFNTDVSLSVLKGFFFVIAQIILFNSNLFFASLDIAKCPLCAGSNEPPRTPIFIFFLFNLFSYFTTTCDFIFIRN